MITLAFSMPVYGMKRYLIIGAFSLDTLAVTPILLIISLAGIFDNYNWNNKKSLFEGLTLSFIPVILFIYLQSLSTIII